MRGQKVLMVANTTWYLYNFRLPLARYLRDLGYEVVLVSPPDAYVERVQAESFRWVDLGLNRRSLNPLKELGALWRFWSIYRDEKPDVCHHFTIKCVIYGTLAAKFAGVKAVVNAITGLGHAFLGRGLMYRLLRPALRFVYRKILTARRVQVIFQNGDDYQEFQDLKMVVPEKVTIIRGSGVNLHRFAPRPSSPDDPPSPTVLLASRLIKEKGVVEYVAAARALRAEGLDVRFCLAGTVDNGNPSAISQEMLDQWVEEGAIDYLGHIDQIEDLLHVATLVVLPSYREGTPRILLEAAAAGKPIVATDVPGCREVVKHGVNGLLVPAGDAEALAEAMRSVLSNPDMLKKFGTNSRDIALDFCESKVISQTAEVYLKAQLKTGAGRV